MPRSKMRGASSKQRLNATTERAYAIVEGRAKDFDWTRRPDKRRHPARMTPAMQLNQPSGRSD
jgi:hypothetical protein